jgi:hypothetical protein
MDTIAQRMQREIANYNNNPHDYDIEIIQLYQAYVDFANAYATFDNDKNFDNWKKTKDASDLVLQLANSPELRNIIWRSNTFNYIVQNVWIHSELDRLNAPAHERMNPYSYLQRIHAEQNRRQEEARVFEEANRAMMQSATPPAAGGSSKKSKKSKRSRRSMKSKKFRKTKSRRH